MPSCRRLAMLGVMDSHQTPLTRVSGLERSVEVRGLGEGDVVEMVVQRRQGESLTIRLAEGSTSLTPTEWVSYSMRKVAGPEPLPTTIEVILDG